VCVCADPSCYQAKVSVHVVKLIAAEPQLVQIGTAYGEQQERSKVLPRNQYAAIPDGKPKTKEQANRSASLRLAALGKLKK
jgi:ParB family transcriptional regulator, chromosome partitioning protein